MGRGHNIIKKIAEEVLNINLTHYNKKKNKSEVFDYELLYRDMKELLIEVYDTDAEIVFKLHDKDLKDIIKYLKPQTSGASISPISPKNLKIGKGDNVYKYNDEQIEAYKEITSNLNKGDILVLNRINNKFLDKILTKKTKKTLDEIKSDMKYKQLKTKDYIYSEGYEKEYLEFLKKEIKDYVKSKN